jgi:nitroreductase
MESVLMKVREAIARRVSIRRYMKTPIPPEHMETLFRALQSAPSASNEQNWEFVFVSDPGLKHHLIGACFNQKFIGDCSYFIAGVADPGLKWHMVDITIALTNFTLQATELGYGTCWIGAFDEIKVKELLWVPKEKKVVICMTFGIPAGKHLPRGRKAVEDFIYQNQYGYKPKRHNLK